MWCISFSLAQSLKSVVCVLRGLGAPHQSPLGTSSLEFVRMGTPKLGHRLVFVEV